MNILPNLLLFCLLIGGGIALQIFLSKRESKWPGLILPAVTLLLSLLVVMGLVAFNTNTSVSSTQTLRDENGVISEITVERQDSPTENPGSFLLGAAMVFLLYNIPTAVLLAIYAACREKRKRASAMEKMRVQDLE